MQSIDNTLGANNMAIYLSPPSPGPDNDNSPSLSASQTSDSSFMYQDDEYIGLDGTKRRRRTTPEELAVLEAEYARCTLPDSKERVRIGNLTNMSARSVQIWFQNKRQTDKRKAAGITRRTAKRSSSTASLPASFRDGADSDTDVVKKKRKTLDEAASAAQNRGPTSPTVLKEIEMNAAFAIARMHSAPFQPNRRVLGENPAHSGLSRFASTNSLPLSFSKQEPPALVRAYSMPDPKTRSEAPIWERMVSSPQTSPYMAPFSRKRPFDVTKENHEDIPFKARESLFVQRPKSAPREDDETSCDPDLSFSDSISNSSCSEPITPASSFPYDSILGVPTRPSSALSVSKSDLSSAIIKAVEKVATKAEELPTNWETQAAELLCFMASGKGEKQ